MIRDEHTSRCSSQWRVYSERDWQTAPGREETLKNEALCEEPVLASTPLVALSKATPMTSQLNAIGDASMLAF